MGVLPRGVLERFEDLKMLGLENVLCLAYISHPEDLLIHDMMQIGQILQNAT